MDLFSILLLGAVFLFAVSLVALAYLFWNGSHFAEKLAVKRRLLYISAGGNHGQEKLTKYRDKVLRDVGFIERLALKIPRLSGLDKMLLKAGLPLNASVFILGSLVLGGLGLLAGLQFLPHKFAAATLGALLLSLPCLLLKKAERSYYARFEEQLPEALDLLSRAMKSGSALSTGIEMIGTEMEDPIKREFHEVADEMKLGLTMQEAFDNLCERVPNRDLRFFAIATLAQKETGGNLSEILDNISRLIRERMQFRQHVKALTAEGTLSAMVLIALPILMFLYTYFANYEYISLLWTEKIGHYLLGGALLLQVVGGYIIRKIVIIEM